MNTIEEAKKRWLEGDVSCDPSQASSIDFRIIKESFDLIRDGEVRIPDEEMAIMGMAEESRNTKESSVVSVENSRDLIVFTCMAMVVRGVWGNSVTWEERGVPQGAFVNHWSNLLKSGKYLQGESKLKYRAANEKDYYCCLGVICDSYVQGSWDNAEIASYISPVDGSLHASRLPPYLSSLLFGRKWYIEDMLIMANDLDFSRFYVPDSLLERPFGVVTAVLDRLPFMEYSGLLFKEYAEAIRVFNLLREV